MLHDRYSRRMSQRAHRARVGDLEWLFERADGPGLAGGIGRLRVSSQGRRAHRWPPFRVLKDML
jgi:hypothetical protein